MPSEAQTCREIVLHSFGQALQWSFVVHLIAIFDIFFLFNRALHVFDRKSRETLVGHVSVLQETIICRSAERDGLGDLFFFNVPHTQLLVGRTRAE